MSDGPVIGWPARSWWDPRDLHGPHAALVHKEPEQTVFFVGLGENALNFEVRVGPYSPLRTRHSESVK